MALLRVSALGAAVLACAVASSACNPAGAQPTGSTTGSATGSATGEATYVASGLTPPAGWSALPGVATAAANAIRAAGVTLEGSEAWGEPARGCYAVWLAMRGARAAAAQVLDGLEAEGITLTDVVRPTTDDGIATASFEKGAYRGRLRARATAGRLVALACFANEREPASCEDACTTLLGGLP